MIPNAPVCRSMNGENQPLLTDELVDIQDVRKTTDRKFQRTHLKSKKKKLKDVKKIVGLENTRISFQLCPKTLPDIAVDETCDQTPHHLTTI